MYVNTLSSRNRSDYKGEKSMVLRVIGIPGALTIWVVKRK